MHIESFRKYCLSLPGVEETLPFGPDALVYKVYGKVFAITSLESEEFTVNLKCDPDRAIELRDQFPGEILPGWHMNKKHWNTVLFAGGIAERMLYELINHSYQLVIAGLPLHVRKKLP